MRLPLHLPVVLFLLSTCFIVCSQDVADESRVRDGWIEKGLRPKNLLRAHLGARGGSGPNCALLSDDPTIPFELYRGKYALRFALGDLHVVNEFAFVNDRSEGTLSIEVSTDESRWTKVFDGDLLAESRRMRFRFPPAEARFLKLAFNVETPGAVYGAGLFGLTLSGDYEVVQLTEEEMQDQRDRLVANPVSLTITPTDAKAAWVSSMEDRVNHGGADSLIDENAFTAHVFSEDDSRPSVLVDLRKTSTVRRVKVLCEESKGTLRLSFIADRGGWETQKPIDSVPGGGKNPIGKSAVEDWNGSPDIDQNFASGWRKNRIPSDGIEGSVQSTDLSGSGRFSFDDLVAEARYMLVTWLPGDHASRGFAINEIAVFSDDRSRLVKPRESFPIRAAADPAQPATPVNSKLSDGGVGETTAGALEAEGTGDGVDLDLEPVSR